MDQARRRHPAGRRAKAALKHAGNVAGDGDPLPEREARRVEAMTARTVDDVLDGFLRHAKVKGLRTVEQMESLLRRYVRPKIGSRRINSLKRSEITALLDDIAAQPSKRSRDEESRRVADLVLGVVRSAFGWHAARDDEFVSPIVKGMARTTLKELSRDRILDDARSARYGGRSTTDAGRLRPPCACATVVRRAAQRDARMQWPRSSTTCPCWVTSSPGQADTPRLEGKLGPRPRRRGVSLAMRNRGRIIEGRAMPRRARRNGVDAKRLAMKLISADLDLDRMASLKMPATLDAVMADGDALHNVYKVLSGAHRGLPRANGRRCCSRARWLQIPNCQQYDLSYGYVPDAAPSPMRRFSRLREPIVISDSGSIARLPFATRRHQAPADDVLGHQAWHFASWPVP